MSWQAACGPEARVDKLYKVIAQIGKLRICNAKFSWGVGTSLCHHGTQYRELMLAIWRIPQYSEMSPLLCRRLTRPPSVDAEVGGLAVLYRLRWHPGSRTEVVVKSTTNTTDIYRSVDPLPRNEPTVPLYHVMKLWLRHEIWTKGLDNIGLSYCWRRAIISKIA